MDEGTAPNPQRDNPRIPAGYTFLGQFLDHDITFDPTSSLEQQNDPNALHNFRTPAFELDSLYGGGPGVTPFLYDRNTFGKLLLVEHDASRVDVPRNLQDVALIGDPRNDENLIVSQLHAAFARFHNEVLEKHTSGRPDQRFTQAQALVRWHYQWMVLHDFLERIVGRALIDEVLALPPGQRVYRPRGEDAFIPVEFSVAAYRFGHSQVRAGYSINAGFGAALFPDDAEAPQSGPETLARDLRGGQSIQAAEAVDWTRFFDFGGASRPQPGKKIDTRLNTRLLKLPATVVPATLPPELRSLAVRNLQRGEMMGLPSGQAVARAMRLPVLPEEQLWSDAPAFRGAPAPLWYYILKEAQEQQDPEFNTTGTRLGPVGGRIVAEVFIGLLQADRQSFLGMHPDWKPHLGATPGQFTLVDLLRVARVV
jgi:hypothetical protein